MTPKETELYRLTHQVRTLFHQMANATDALHIDNGITAGMRAILEMLSGGEKTVPDMARARRVSRQHIQILVNDLIDAGLVESQFNPSHKKSSLIVMTPKGENMFAKMRSREETLLSAAAKTLSSNDIAVARKALAALDTFFSEYSAAPQHEKEK